MQNLEEVIRERAYHLWMADGRPEGNSDAYWLNAQREVLTTSLDGSVTARPAKKAKVAAPRKSRRSAA